MGFFEAVILGIVQGLTEFLPVSSSGHLVLTQSLFKNFEQPGLLYDTLLHFATLLAVVLYFRKRVSALLLSMLGVFGHKYRVIYFENKRFFWGIIIASIPTAIIGLYMESSVESFFSYPSFVGYFLILTSVLLKLSDRYQGVYQIGPRSSFLIGVVQGLAVIPGISRSGSTVAAGLFLGISRAEMAEFTFLMSIPAILGATLLQLRHIEFLAPGQLPIYFAGMTAAFLSGFAAISFMVFFIKRANLSIFAYYCLILGIIAIVWM